MSDGDTARPVADLFPLAEEARAWSKTLRADSLRVEREVANSEAILAETLARLAQRYPHHRRHFRAKSEEAATRSASMRRRAAYRQARHDLENDRRGVGTRSEG